MSTTRSIELVVREYEDDERNLDALRMEGGFIDPVLLRQVEEAIREYPNQDAPQWLGGVAAIRAVERWLIERAGGLS